MPVSGQPVFRTLLIILLAFAAVLAAAAGIAVHQRITVVQWLLAEVLTARGMRSTRFVVEDVGLDHLVVSGVRSDSASGLSVGRIALRYAPLEILDRHIRGLEIEGFEFSVVAPDDGSEPSFDIPVSPFGPSGGGGPGWTIGTIDLRDTRIAVEGRWTAEVVVDGTARHLEDQSYDGTLRLRGSVAPPGLPATKLDGSVAFTASPQGLKAMTGAFTANPLHLPNIATRQGRLEAAFRDGLLTLRGEVLTEDGRIDLEAEGPLPTGASPVALRGRTTVDLDLAGIDIPGVPAPVAVKGRALVVSDDQALSVRALQPLVAALADKRQPAKITISPHAEPFLVTGPLERIPAGAEVRIAEARVEIAERAVTVNDLDATVTIDPTRQIDLRRAEISDLGPSPSLPTLNLAGRVSLDDRRLLFKGTARGAGDKLVVDFDGNHRIDSGIGRARLRFHPLAFRPGELQPADLIRGLGDTVSAVNGRIEAGGDVAWGHPTPASDFTLQMRDLSLDVAGIHVEGVDGKVVIDRLWPPRTPPNQTLIVRRIDVGAPMTDAVVRFRIDDRMRLAIEEARVDLLGGRFSVGPAIFDPAADRQRATVRLTGFDMETLLAIAEIDGAAASGKLGGEVPLVVSSDGFSVTDAVLSTDAPGVLRYAPAIPPPALQGGGEGVSLMLEAMKNFHYDVVSVSVDGRSGDEWSVKLHVEGKNPDFMDAYPFVFNLNLSGRLDEIIRTGLQSYELPARVGEGLSKGRPGAGK